LDLRGFLPLESLYEAKFGPEWTTPGGIGPESTVPDDNAGAVRIAGVKAFAMKLSEGGGAMSEPILERDAITGHYRPRQGTEAFGAGDSQAMALENLFGRNGDAAAAAGVFIKDQQKRHRHPRTMSRDFDDDQILQSNLPLQSDMQALSAEMAPYRLHHQHQRVLTFDMSSYGLGDRSVDAVSSSGFAVNDSGKGSSHSRAPDGSAGGRPLWLQEAQHGLAGEVIDTMGLNSGFEKNIFSSGGSWGGGELVAQGFNAGVGSLAGMDGRENAGRSPGSLVMGSSGIIGMTHTWKGQHPTSGLPGLPGKEKKGSPPSDGQQSFHSSMPSNVATIQQEATNSVRCVDGSGGTSLGAALGAFNVVGRSAQSGTGKSSGLASPGSENLGLASYSRSPPGLDSGIGFVSSSSGASGMPMLGEGDWLRGNDMFENPGGSSSSMDEESGGTSGVSHGGIGEVSVSSGPFSTTNDVAEEVQMPWMTVVQADIDKNRHHQQQPQQQQPFFHP
jgi:hypothetical protein